LPQTVLGS